MIRYSITATELAAKVDAIKSNWQSRARKRTQNFAQRKTYFEPPAPIWSEIKTVFMALQNDKCAYCERKFAAGTLGALELDVEHFRPKNAVAAWPPASSPGYAFPTGGDFPAGYYLLAYHLGNYAVACKPCNTILKASYFPIAGVRISDKHEPADLKGEQPLLIFPIGDQTDDPQALIRFDGQIPVPVSTDVTAYDYQRARVTIDFFQLVSREELLRERCELIFLMTLALRGSNAEAVRILTSPSHPHTNCAQCFQSLFVSDQQAAELLAKQALDYLKSVHNSFLHQ